MTIEKSPAAATQPAAHTKGPSAAKASKGAAAESKSSGQDAFMDLLLGLGADDVEVEDATAANLPLADSQLVVADPVIDSSVALLAQQNWSPLTSPLESKDAVSTEVPLNGILRDSFMPLQYSDRPNLETGVPASDKPKLASRGKTTEIATERFPIEKLQDSAGPSKKPSKMQANFDSAGLAMGIEKVSSARSMASQIERKAPMDVVPKLDTLGLLSGQTSKEFILTSVGLKSEVRLEKVIFKSGAVEANNAINTRTDLSQPVPNVEALLSDRAVGPAFAEPTQDAYWVSSDMKNAEMKLDGIGEGPVEVSISLHGKEAHISFRSDEEQTRTALQDAESSLKDMLRSEGLELSGVSIGLAGSNFGSGAERRQDSRPLSDMRSFKIDSVLHTGDGNGLTQAVGRESGNLDVFV